MQIQNDRKLQPPLARPELPIEGAIGSSPMGDANVSCPLLVGRISDEVSIQQVRCNVELVITVRRYLVFACSDD